MGAFAAAGAWPGVLGRLVAGEELDAELARATLERMLEGEASDAQIAAWCAAMAAKGPSPGELAGMVDAMLAEAAPLELDDPDATIDLVGTGGSRALGGPAFNVSTMASLVAAAAGATVCKHGNRRASSASGSTDLLEALGVEVDLDGPGVAACVAEARVGFAFARRFHPAMRHVAAVRTELGIPTVFNLLGPLSHPGHVRRAVVGVADPELVDLVAATLARRRMLHAWVVHGDGLDELTTTASTDVVEVREGAVSAFTVDAVDLGLRRASLEELAVGGPEENAAAARSVLAGEPGPLRDMVLLNAAAGLVVAGRSTELGEGLATCAAAIDGGAARATLELLVGVSRGGAGEGR